MWQFSVMGILWLLISLSSCGLAYPQEKDDEVSCRTDSDCTFGEICEGTKCILGCRTDYDCNFDKACINNRCIDPCTVQDSCGRNADCRPIVHRPHCTCRAGYEGNPNDHCKENAMFQKDLQDFVRRLTQQPAQQLPTTHQDIIRPHYAQFPSNPLPRAQEMSEDQGAVVPRALEYPTQSYRSTGARAYASAYSSVKRPSGDEAGSQANAVAFSSVKDVNDEESLAENIESVEKLTTLSVGPLSLSTQEQKSTSGDSNRSKDPYTSKQQQVVEIKDDDSFGDVYFVAIVAGCCAVGIFGIISAGFCFYRLQKSRKAAADVDYPAYGVTGPCKDVVSPSGDRKLAQSAQMYHYQHQKQQMIAVEKAGSTKNTSASDVDSEEENEEGDYTVYECPGLAPTGEMEVKNPLFHDDSTPVSPPVAPKSDSIHNN